MIRGNIKLYFKSSTFLNY